MKKSDFLIALVANERPDENYESEDLYADWDSTETLNKIADSIRFNGYKCIRIPFDEHFVQNLQKECPNLVFNIAEGFKGEDRECQAAAILEYLGIPYTGSGPLGRAVALNKPTAKKLMEFHGVKTAPFKVFEEAHETHEVWPFGFPAIVKPSHEGSSIGVDNNAYCEDFEQLQTRVEYIIKKFNQPALAEKFILGREFNNAIIGNEKVVQFPVVEIVYDYLPKGIHHFSSFEVKTSLDDPNSTVCPAPITLEEEKNLKAAALGAYRALGIKDYARVDMRMDETGQVYILEVNAIPGIAPGIEENNSMPKAVRTFGWTYEQMIELIIKSALARYQIQVEP
jgi:D-alanine-D-alanine ligase